MDYSPHDSIKKEKPELVECDMNDNFQELLFDVEIKVEKELETEDVDWCVGFESGDLLEPLFFKEATETQFRCPFCFSYFSDSSEIFKHNLTHLQVTIVNPRLFQCDCCAAYFTDKRLIKHHILTSNVSASRTRGLSYKPKAFKSMVAAEIGSNHKLAKLMLDNSVTKKEQANLRLHSSVTKKEQANLRLHSSVTKKEQANLRLHSSVTKKEQVNLRLDSSETEKDPAILMLDSSVTKTEKDPAILMLDRSVTKKEPAILMLDSSVTKKQPAILRLDSSVTKEINEYNQVATTKKLKDGLTNLLKYKPKTYKPRNLKPSKDTINAKNHQCNICLKMYNYKNWHSHMRTVHGDGGYFCSLCDMEFKCERYFLRHMAKRHTTKMPKVVKPKGAVKTNIKCDHCDAILHSLYALTTHKRNVHSDNTHICKICNSELKCKSYLLAHMRRVHYNDGKQHACECGKSFKSPRYLKVHKKNAHSK